MRHERRQTAARRPLPEIKIVDINAATQEQLAKVAGIGPKLAEAIVAERPFRSWDDVRKVPGFSQGLVKQLRSTGVRLGPAVHHAGGQ